MSAAEELQHYMTACSRLRERIADLEAENARLQERVEEAKDKLADYNSGTVVAKTGFDRAIRERDGYKAHMGEAWQEYRRLWLRWFEQRVEYRYAKKREREAKALA